MVVVLVVVVIVVVVVLCENTSTCFSVVGFSGGRARGRGGRGGGRARDGRGDLRKHINLLQCCGFFRRQGSWSWWSWWWSCSWWW